MRRARWILVMSVGVSMVMGPLPADYETTTLIRRNNRKLQELGAHRALWVRDRTVITKRASTRFLVNFAHQKGISQLFVAADRINSGQHDEWRHLTREAHQNGMDVFGLASEAAWPQRPRLMDEYLRQITLFQRNTSAGDWLDGILLDLTPYLESIDVLGPDQLMRFTPGTEIEATVDNEPQLIDAEEPSKLTEDQARDLVKVLDLLQRARADLDRFHESLRFSANSSSYRLQLGVALPPGLDALADFDGSLKPVYQHVVDIADFVVALSYSDASDKIHGTVQDVLNYASQEGKTVLIGVSTHDEGRYPPEVTFFDEDQYQMELSLSELIAQVAQEASFEGVAIHEYHSYFLLPQNRFLNKALPPDTRTPLLGEGAAHQR